MVSDASGERESAAQAAADIRTVEVILSRRVAVARARPVRRKRHLALFLGGLAVAACGTLAPAAHAVHHPARHVAAAQCRPRRCGDRDGRA